MKKQSRIISLLLALVMSFSLFSIPVMAEEKKEETKVEVVEKAEEIKDLAKEEKTEEAKEEIKADEKVVNTEEIKADEEVVNTEASDDIRMPEDVKEGDWYFKFVYFCIENGLMTGVEENIFSPLDITDRASVFQVLYNAEKQPEVKGETSFTDIEGKWYEKSASWAEDVKITSGKGDNKFDGDTSVTRQEIATIFWNYAKSKGFTAKEADLSKFADNEEISTWAKESVAYAVDLGLLTGREDNTLDPLGNTTRGELATVIYKFYKLEKKPVEVPVEKPEEKPEVKPEEKVVIGKVKEVSKYGNVTLDITTGDLKGKALALGDMLVVKISDKTIEIPFVSSYSDVNNGSALVRGSKDDAKAEIIVAINMGNLAETYSLKVGDEISISLKEKGAYLDEYEIRQLERTNERDDYSSDEVFANFRNVKMGKLVSGVLYRSSSPINNELNRAAFADKFAKEAGIKTVINLADSKEELEGYFKAEDFNSPYYKELYDNGKVSYLDMGVDFKAQDFKDKLKVGLTFMSENEGPFLIHCNEGKDRAGFVAALLEALMGGTVEEIKTDYLVTYINYYHVEKGSEQYDKIAESNILESLRSIAGLKTGESLENVNLEKAAEDYIKGLGITDDQLNKIRTSLSTSVAVTELAA